MKGFIKTNSVGILSVDITQILNDGSIKNGLKVFIFSQLTHLCVINIEISVEVNEENEP